MMDIKKMWMVTFDLNKYQVDVLYDKDSGKVTHYCNNGENDFFSSCKGIRYFTLEEDADDYIRQRIQFLLEKDEEVINLIEEMYMIDVDNETVGCDFKTTKNLWKWCIDRSEEKICIQNRNARLENIVSRLSHALRSGYLNIDADTFRVEDVALIRWLSSEKEAKKEVEITLSNGKVLNIKNKTELEIIKYIYGENTSGYVYVSKNEKK